MDIRKDGNLKKTNISESDQSTTVNKDTEQPQTGSRKIGHPPREVTEQSTDGEMKTNIAEGTKQGEIATSTDITPLESGPIMQAAQARQELKSQIENMETELKGLNENDKKAILLKVKLRVANTLMKALDDSLNQEVPENLQEITQAISKEVSTINKATHTTNPINKKEAIVELKKAANEYLHHTQRVATGPKEGYAVVYAGGADQAAIEDKLNKMQENLDKKLQNALIAISNDEEASLEDLKDTLEVLDTLEKTRDIMAKTDQKEKVLGKIHRSICIAKLATLASIFPGILLAFIPLLPALITLGVFKLEQFIVVYLIQREIDKLG